MGNISDSLRHYRSHMQVDKHSHITLSALKIARTILKFHLYEQWSLKTELRNNPLLGLTGRVESQICVFFLIYLFLFRMCHAQQSHRKGEYLGSYPYF